MATVEDCLISELPSTLRSRLCQLAADLASTGEAAKAARVLCTALRECVNLDPLRKPQEYSLIMRSIGHVLSRLPQSDSLRACLIRMYGKILSRPRAQAPSEAPALIEASLHAFEGGPDAALAALGRREFLLPKYGEAVEWLSNLRGEISKEKRALIGLSELEKFPGKNNPGEIDDILAVIPRENQPEWIWRNRVTFGFFTNFQELISLNPPGAYRPELNLIFVEKYPENSEALEISCRESTSAKLWPSERVILWYRIFWSKLAVKVRSKKNLEISGNLLTLLTPQVTQVLPETTDVILARLNLEISSR